VRNLSLIIDFERPYFITETETHCSFSDYSQVNEVLELLYEQLERIKINYSFRISFPFCIINAKNLKAFLESNRIISNCQLKTGDSIIFSCDNEVFACNYLTQVKFGKLNKDFNDFNSFKTNCFKSIQECFVDFINRYPAEKCLECEHAPICGGGCIMHLLHFDKKIINLE